MRDKDTVVFEFLRDAQYRVAELSTEIDTARRNAVPYDDQEDLRMQLAAWMDILWDSITSIRDYYTLLDWTDREVIAECDYLRSISGMAEIPYITFSGYHPQIISKITGESTGGNLPNGQFNQIISYDVSENPYALDFPEEGGMLDNESIDEYFG